MINKCLRITPYQSSKKIRAKQGTIPHLTSIEASMKQGLLISLAIVFLMGCGAGHSDLTEYYR